MVLVDSHFRISQGMLSIKFATACSEVMTPSFARQQSATKIVNAVVVDTSSRELLPMGLSLFALEMN